MYQNMKEPRDVFLMYRYSSKYDHDYERITNEVIKEYRQGILDPTRVVGKVERTRGKVRKQIEDMKHKYSKMSAKKTDTVL